ncbi:hypothetical protein [Myroides marinus]|uniref:hypothetical protein n=1 Tax=Myroides marinus TaxID=703342 RepID=UPI002574FBA6|nr:hypothetical protein [Myroides marinus]MDM1354077.1 hypothetical protein [Myroides marinus]MDM1369378.1 hypothetical protein [Myroides marinus]MDM1404601.1 hypothetical protein [Myroides marinus]
MKNLLCLLLVFFSLNCFSQAMSSRGPLYPMDPKRPEVEYWKKFTFFSCDTNGKKIVDIQDPMYKRYELEFLVSAPSGHGIFSFYHQRVEKQICELGKITEYSPAMRIIRIVGTNGKDLGNGLELIRLDPEFLFLLEN